MNTTTDTGFGHEAASLHSIFAAAYRIIVGERGTQIDGGSPDGRCVGTCDRCGTCIQNIYVFRNRKGDSYMHVGIDCAAKMGVPVTELKAARNHWRNVAREAGESARRASHAERQAAERALRNARAVANAGLIGELESLAADPNATEWERNALGAMIAHVTTSDAGADWMDPESDRYDGDWNTDLRNRLESIRDRLALCATSKAVVAGKKGLAVTLRGYRNPIRIEGSYGTTYVCFLTDDAVNAFVYKGSHCFGFGRVVEATWSTEGTDTRDGLTATVLKRPRKFAKTEEEIAEEARVALLAAQLESDRLLIANAVGVAATDVHYANAGRGLYVVESGDHRRAYQVCGFDWRPNGPKWEVSPIALPSASGLVLWQGIED